MDVVTNPMIKGLGMVIVLLVSTTSPAVMLAATQYDDRSADQRRLQEDPVCQIKAGDKSLARYEARYLPLPFKVFEPFLHKDERLLQVTCITVRDRLELQYLLATRAPKKVGTISILARQHDNSLRLEATNHTVVQIDGAEGSGAGGEFESIAAKPNEFTIYNLSGDRCHLSEYAFKFLYSPVARTWVLDSITTTRVVNDTSTDQGEVEQSQSVLTERDFGQVTFGAFDGKKYGILESTKVGIDEVNSTLGRCL